MQQENLVDIRHKLSIIYKHIQSIHNELRYPAKIHAISEKLSKEKIKKFYISPPNYYYYYFFFMLKKKTEKIKINIYKNKKKIILITLIFSLSNRTACLIKH